MKNETTIEVQNEREVVVRRTFNGPARIVFDAWTKPELLKRWWSPKSMGMTLIECDIDLRTGGKYRFLIGMGDRKMEFFGKYVEVTPPNRISWTNEESGDQGPVTTVTFTEKDGKTLLVMTELYPSKEALDTGAAEHMKETFEQLDALLSDVKA